MNLPADHPAIAQTLSFVRDTGLSARSAWAITTPVLHAAILHGLNPRDLQDAINARN